MNALADAPDHIIEKIQATLQSTQSQTVELSHSLHAEPEICIEYDALPEIGHAAGEDSIKGSSLALTMWDVLYLGKPAHAAAAPEQGVNALDALVVAQTAITLSRQQTHQVGHEFTDLQQDTFLSKAYAEAVGVGASGMAVAAAPVALNPEERRRLLAG